MMHIAVFGEMEMRACVLALASLYATISSKFLSKGKT